MTEINEVSHDGWYSGSVTRSDRKQAALEIGLECEAELALLLMSAARRGVLRLDRILPFLDDNVDLPGPMPSEGLSMNLEEFREYRKIVRESGGFGPTEELADQYSAFIVEYAPLLLKWLGSDDLNPESVERGRQVRRLLDAVATRG